MTDSQIKPDPAAIFAAAFSLWEACTYRAKHDPNLNLSDAYSGYDQLMREVMRIGETFEAWACEHIDFDANNEVWPYMLGNQFGETCLKLFHATELADFSADDCYRVAVKLSLPIKPDDTLPIPIDITIENPQSQIPVQILPNSNRPRRRQRQPNFAFYRGRRSHRPGI